MKQQFTTKAAARTWAKAQVSHISTDEQKMRSATICKHLIAELNAMPDLAGNRLFFYAALAGEPDLGALVSAVKNVSFALPRVISGHGMEFRAFSHGELLNISKWGIPEPRPSAEIVTPRKGDVMLVPCVALGKGGERLGHGRGYYDRHIAGFEHRPRMLGVCFDAVLCESGAWTKESHDILMNGYCSESGIVWA